MYSVDVGVRATIDLSRTCFFPTDPLPSEIAEQGSSNSLGSGAGTALSVQVVVEASER